MSSNNPDGILTHGVSQPDQKRFRIPVMIRIIVVLLIVIIISFIIGRYEISVWEVFSVLTGTLFHQESTLPTVVETVVLQVRLPRILAAIIIGMALAISGASYQGLFRNPMVSPDILGASSGAGFGAAIAILISWNTVLIQFTSFLFGLAAVFLSYMIASKIARGGSSVLMLVLTGMVVSAMFSAFISMIKYMADMDGKLPAITFWLMGSLSSVTMPDLLILLIPFLLGCIPLFLLRWKLNVLSFGEDEAKALGINTKRIRIVIILCATLLTASSVSVCGMIGWVGLVIPHIARMVVGPNYRILIPASTLMGGTFLLLVDDLARSVSSFEIPLGILTAVMGAPFFLAMLLYKQKL
ncbi:MAG: iron ABC transporter permease [Peptococcaceae bacterium]|nr:iron ABC transporter permease [Peptococcaceae bacterium]